jgi:hypothetical protein
MQGLKSLGGIVASLAADSNVGNYSSVGNGMIFLEGYQPFQGSPSLFHVLSKILPAMY